MCPSLARSTIEAGTAPVRKRAEGQIAKAPKAKVSDGQMGSEAGVEPAAAGGVEAPALATWRFGNLAIQSPSLTVRVQSLDAAP